jgi:hypothetical protein
VGLHICSRLEEVEKALDAGILASLDGLHDTEAGTLAGGMFSLAPELWRN